MLTLLPTTNTQKSTEHFTVQVTDQHGNPVGGVSVSVTVSPPSGKTSTVTGTTDSSGLAYFQYKLSATAPLGAYLTTATASVSRHSKSVATATGIFTVS